jgi:6-phosphogluconolactonase
MQLHIYKNANELVDELAKWITDYITNTLKKQNRFTIALSGGETPKSLYRTLSAAPYSNKIDWKKIHFFWGDERVVPFADEKNNAKMAYDTLLSKVEVPAANIHVVTTDLSPDIAAKEYEKILRNYFDGTKNSFDLILLGMGNDGHTLSLFPGSALLDEQDNWVNSVFVEDQKMYRITLMPSIVNKASAIIFLVTGKEKSGALKSVLQDQHKPDLYPAQLIQPLNGQLHWFLDEDAGRKIMKNSTKYP